SRSPTETHERLLDATWRLLEGSRGHEVRLDDIARAAGVSRQALYLHFGSRAALFIATVRYVDERLDLAGRIRQACALGNGTIGLEAYVALWADYLPEIAGIARALQAMRATDEDAASAWDDRMRALREGCGIIVEQLMAERRLAAEWKLDTATDYFWAQMSFTLWEHLTVECGWSREEYAERMQWALKRALLSEG